jgi:hypothetical protein
MVNYDPATARVTNLYTRRITGPGNSDYVSDPEKFRFIRFDVDSPGEDIKFIEPLSNNRFLLDSGESATEPPVEAVEYIDGASDIFRFD